MPLQSLSTALLRDHEDHLSSKRPARITS